MQVVVGVAGDDKRQAGVGLVESGAVQRVLSGLSAETSEEMVQARLGRAPLKHANVGLFS